MEIVIRPYRPEDWPRLMAIHDAARRMELKHAGLDAAFVPLVEAAKREGLFDYAVCVALAQGRVVGFVAYAEDELAWLYVDPACMRQGIGTRLIRYVVESTSHRPLCIEVLAGNTPALQAYKAMGFDLVDTQAGVMPGNESFRVTVWRLQKE